MEIDQAILELVEKAGSEKKITDSEVRQYLIEDLLYDDLIDALEEEGITVLVEHVKEAGEDVEIELTNDFLEEEPDAAILLDEVEEEDILEPLEIITTIKIDDPVRMYLKEIGQTPLINQEKEVELAKIVLAGRYASEQLKSYEDGEVTLSSQDLDYLNNTILDAQDAKNKLVEANYRLVVSIAKRYTNRGMMFLDLIQEGNMGLMKAVDKFDYEKGFKFSTYATWWIRQAITRAVADQARTIRIPVHMVETINKMTRIQRQLFQKLGREPLTEEIAEKMEMTVGKILNIQRISKEPISLESRIGEEEDSSIGDFISDTGTLNPHESMLKDLSLQALNELLVTLTDREEKVLRLRYGLLDGRSYTLEEVGREFNVTRERIRQIEAKALRKLRHPTRQKKLRDFFHENKN